MWLVTILLVFGVTLAEEEEVQRFNFHSLAEALQNVSNSNSGLIVGFVKKNCRHCHRVEPNLRYAKALLDTDPDYNHLVGIIDGDDSSNGVLLDKYKVKHFPLIYIFGPLNKYKGILYRGEPTGESYASAVRLYTGYSPTRLPTLKAVIDRASVLMEGFVMGVFDSKGPMYGKFMNASSRLDFIRFYYLLNPQNENVTKEADSNSTSIYVVHNPFFTETESDDNLDKYDPAETNRSLEYFVVNHLPYKVDICTQQMLKIYRMMGTDYLALFGDLYEDFNLTKKLGKQLGSLYPKYGRRMKMCLANIEKNFMLHLIGENQGEVDIFGFNNTVYQAYEMIDEKKNLNISKLDTWIQQYVNGELQPIDMQKRVNKLKEELQTQKNTTSSEQASQNTTTQSADSLEKERQKVDL